MPGDVPARLGRRLGEGREFELKCDGVLHLDPEFAVWDLPTFAQSRGRIRGRACDDLIGVAGILSTLISLRHSRGAVSATGAITRAEEVGFAGSLALAAAGTLDDDSLVISLETSREIPGVTMGGGVILRVGDRSTVFDSDATRYLHEVAKTMEGTGSSFAVQRALMGGGSCEGTVFHEAGYQTAALCVALGNYHNCGPQRRIRAEFVSERDAMNMVDLLVRAVGEMGRFERLVGVLERRLEGIRRETRSRLRRSRQGGA